MPMARNGVRRQRELELRRDLREMRQAIDAYKAAADGNKIKAPPAREQRLPRVPGQPGGGVPITGKERQGQVPPPDPGGPLHQQGRMGPARHGRRSHQHQLGRGNVFDVYSLAPGKGSNGIPYKDW